MTGRRVYCEECKHYIYLENTSAMFFPDDFKMCYIAVGKEFPWAIAAKKNKNNDCKDYVEKNDPH